MISFHRGQIGPTEALGMLGVDDILGTLRGYRIFTTARTAGGRLLDQVAHLQRIDAAARVMGMTVGDGIENMASAIPLLLDANDAGSHDVVMQLFLSGGEVVSGGMASSGDAWPSVLVRPYHPVDDRLRENGFHLATMVHERAFAAVKFTFYAASVLAHHTVVRQHQADDVLFLSQDSHPLVLEGSTFNVFVVKNGRVSTPPSDGRILAGITRRRVLEWVGGQEVEVSWDERKEWDEVFLCSSVRGVVGVTRLDGECIGNGQVGPVTKQVMATMATALSRFVEGGDYHPG
ncbi:hypothetical protein EBZ35_09030 [bacterium]|nr:hypothetical protein [bacterium]